jgi:hypothetical protein
MSNGRGYQRANQYAMEEIGDLIRENHGGQLKSFEVAAYLNAKKKSRSFTPQRVGCLLRQRDDLTLVIPGIWSVTA